MWTDEENDASHRQMERRNYMVTYLPDRNHPLVQVELNMPYRSTIAHMITLLPKFQAFDSRFPNERYEDASERAQREVQEDLERPLTDPDDLRRRQHCFDRFAQRCRVFQAWDKEYEDSIDQLHNQRPFAELVPRSWATANCENIIIVWKNDNDMDTTTRHQLYMGHYLRTLDAGLGQGTADPMGNPKWKPDHNAGGMRLVRSGRRGRNPHSPVPVEQVATNPVRYTGLEAQSRLNDMSKSLARLFNKGSTC